MTAPERGFPDDEFAARCAAMQAAMAREGVDAMLFASEPEIRYFTGFLTRSGRARPGPGSWCCRRKASRWR